MELAPAPVTCSAGDWVSHVALNGPPLAEHAVLAGAVVALGVGATPWAAVVVVAAGGAAVVEVVDVGVLVVVECDFFLAAVGLDEPQALSTSATTATAETASPARARTPPGCRRPSGSARRTVRITTGAPLGQPAAPSAVWPPVNLLIR